MILLTLIFPNATGLAQNNYAILYSFFLFKKLYSKLKQIWYFGREVQFKKYLHGLSDAGTSLSLDRGPMG